VWPFWRAKKRKRDYTTAGGKKASPCVTRRGTTALMTLEIQFRLRRSLGYRAPWLRLEVISLARRHVAAKLGRTQPEICRGCFLPLIDIINARDRRSGGSSRQLCQRFSKSRCTRRKNKIYKSQLKLPPTRPCAGDAADDPGPGNVAQ
jgi:hypothetical protein